MKKETKKAPTIRFRSFTDDWEQRKLKEVLDLLKDGTHGTHQDADEGPLLLSAKNIKNGEIVWDDSDRRISIEEYNSIHSKFQLQTGDVLLTIVGSVGETAILQNPQGLTFQRSVAFLRPNKHINSEFMCSEIQSNRFQNELKKRKSASAQSGVYLGDLQEISFIFPVNMDEQRNISSCFYNLDNLITLHQRKLDQLKTLKKYFLQNMFPAKGEKVPRIRFKGFTGDWEQRKFGELYKVNSGYAFRYEDYCFCLDGVALINGESIQHGVIDGTNLNYLPQNFLNEFSEFTLKEGDIVLGLNRPVTNGQLKMARISKQYNNSLLYQRAGKITFKKKMDENFSYVLLSNEILKYTVKEAVGSDQPFISTSKLSDWNMNIPDNIQEQKSIGTFFASLDKAITLHQRKLEQLQTMKKFMLQNLFI